MFSWNLPMSLPGFQLLLHGGYYMQITCTRSTKIRPQSNRVIVIRNDTPSPFARELTRKEEKILDVDCLELEDLKEELHDIGESFEKEPTIANFRVFREMIGRFARKATSLAYRIEKVKNVRSGSILEIVSIIDRNADALYHIVMQGQQNRFNIASRIASINGMIIKVSA
jgi:uncharacterized protein YaaR (DUF327 family)